MKRNNARSLSAALALFAAALLPCSAYAVRDTAQEEDPQPSISVHMIDSMTRAGIYGAVFQVCDDAGMPVHRLSTDRNGYAWTETELPPGSYEVRLTELPEGYLSEEHHKTVQLAAGDYRVLEWQSIPVTGQLRVMKCAAEPNAVTGQRKGDGLKGAIYEIVREQSGELMGYMTTDAQGCAASPPLPLGTYLIREVAAPEFWRASEQRYRLRLAYAGQRITFTQYALPASDDEGGF